MTQEQIYQTIADAISLSASKEWEYADLYLRIIGESVNAKLYFEYTDSTNEYVILRNNIEVSKCAKHYHKMLHETGNAKWNIMNFKLYKTGKFSIDFVWDQTIEDNLKKYK